MMIEKIQSTRLDRQKLEGLKISLEDLQGHSCDYSKVIVNKPWGHEYLIFHNDAVAVWLLYLKRGFQTSMHCHPNKKTSLVVLGGRTEFYTLGRRLKRAVGEGVMMEEKVFHQTKAVSGKGALVLELETPTNKHDLVRLKDKYGREGKRYETLQSGSSPPNTNYLTFPNNGNSSHVERCLGSCKLSFLKMKSKEAERCVVERQGKSLLAVLKGQFAKGTRGDFVKAGEITALRNLKETSLCRSNLDFEILIIDILSGAK